VEVDRLLFVEIMVVTMKVMEFINETHFLIFRQSWADKPPAFGHPLSKGGETGSEP